MPARPGAGDGFTVLDGAALVVGAAVAAVHIRGATQPAEGMDAMGWILLWITLAGVAVTAAGPVVLVVRRYGRRPEGYPRTGDWLWALLGLPWLLTAPLLGHELGGLVLAGGTALASLAALAVLWQTWVAVAPDQARFPPSWTARLGMVLAIAWPLQCGFVLAVGRF